MIFALQTSGKYGWEQQLNSMLYISVNGKPGDIIKPFSHKLQEEISFQDFIDNMDKFRFDQAGSEFDCLMEWYMSYHNGEDMAILSNGQFAGLGEIGNFDNYLSDRLMMPTGNITWFNPFLG